MNISIYRGFQAGFGVLVCFFTNNEKASAEPNPDPNPNPGYGSYPSAALSFVLKNLRNLCGAKVEKKLALHRYVLWVQTTVNATDYSCGITTSTADDTLLLQQIMELHESRILHRPQASAGGGCCSAVFNFKPYARLSRTRNHACYTHSTKNSRASCIALTGASPSSAEPWSCPFHGAAKHEQRQEKRQGQETPCATAAWGG